MEPHPLSLGHRYISFSRNKPELVETGTPITTQLTGMQQHFEDFWRSDKDYKSLLEATGFSVENVLEPVLNASIPGRWFDEKVQAPSIIYCARKK